MYPWAEVEGCGVVPLVDCAKRPFYVTLRCGPCLAFHIELEYPWVEQGVGNGLWMALTLLLIIKPCGYTHR